MREPRTRLDVRLRHRIGALEVNVELELTRPWTILFGASGSGKTTILRAIAGLLRPDEGRIVLSGTPNGQQVERRVLLDTEAHVFVPAHERQIPLASQRPALFPHRTVEQNVRFGIAGRADGEQDGHLAWVLREFQLEELAGKHPAQLSGGEAQRVNLARAVAAGGRLLLLDEPFTGLDAPRRERLQSVLMEISRERGLPILSVTHDIAEAFQVGADVIRLEEGHVVRRGPAEEVLADERARLLDVLRETRRTADATHRG